MLRRTPLRLGSRALVGSLAALAALASRSPASAADSVGEPERLTAGSADQFLAVLDPDASRMFYVSNENATTELFGVDLDVRAPQRLFDEAADVTWPRVSPDGNTLLYLSFRSAATGELCLRELTPRGLGVSERRCFSLGGRTAMHALWEPGSKSVLVVSREGLGGAIDLRRFLLQGPPEQSGEVLLTRDIGSPAVSHDGRFLLYVPGARQSAGPPVAPSSRAANPNSPAATGSAISANSAASSATPARKSLQLLRLDAADSPERAISFELPGLPGFPAFSADDKFVYFVQYLNDTNHDGVVDANDRGVLFRVPFDGALDAPIDGARAQQLTSAEWDCQYPFPGKNRLVATCLNGGSLDAFSLPLEGAIPGDWTAARLDDELQNTRAPWVRLLLETRLLELDAEPAARAGHLKLIIESHLQMREYQSASFYSGQLEKLAVSQTTPELRSDEGLAQALHELARHRRAIVTMGEGQSTTAFTAAARARIDKLGALGRSGAPAVSALAALVQSEISDGLGEKGRALSLFSQVHADKQVERLVLHLYDQRGRELFESLCDRERLLAVDQLLAEHPALDEAERLAHAGAYVADLLRGRAQADRPALLEEALRASPPESNTAFELQLALALQGLGTGTQGEVEKRVLALFDKTPGFERRHSIAHETIARAKATDSETLWYDIAEKWAVAAEKERPGHRRSEALYRTVALERAYVEWAEGKLPAAREHFDAVTRHSSSLEAYADGIDISLQSGAENDELEAAVRRRFASTPDEPELAFALAHLEARKLGSESDPQAVSRQAEEAKGRLKSALRALPNNVPIHYLWAFLRHQEYLRTGDENTALRANAHYLIVVDLARDDPRYRAAALSGLGFLHAGLQNHSMAASFFAQREKLPFATPISALAVCLWHAESLLHAAHESEAAALADHCVALVDGAPALTRFLAYALDRAALFHNDAGEPALAQARYERLAPLLTESPGGGPATRRNQFVVELGLASARLASGKPREALADLDRAERIFQQPGGISLLESPSGRESSSTPFSPAVMKDDQEALLTGLRARALTELGDVAGAEVQTKRRLLLLEARAARDGNEASGTDDRKLLALAHADLAAARYQAGDIPGAIAQVEAGLRDADELAVRSATPIHAVALTLLREYAELHFLGHAPLGQLRLDLPGRLGRAYGELADHPQPRWLAMRERYRLYIERLMLEGISVALP